MATKIKKSSKKTQETKYRYDLNSKIEQENLLLKEVINNIQQENQKFKTTPLMVAEVKNIIKNKAIIQIPNGNKFLVEISQECKKLMPGEVVLIEQKSLTIIKKLNVSKKFDIEKFIIMEKPTLQWEEIGGLQQEIQEIQEVIELPLKKPHLFKKMGITPPKGILLHGPPGTGKTLLGKAVAASTNSTFIEIVGSELVQKFIGEGAKLIKEIFELARKKAPAIIFIDELDSIAASRVEVGTSGEREVQRTFMQLLAEIDGFDNLGNVKVIGCTNRKDILDPAVIRPGRLDRLIKIGYPNEQARHEIFKIHSKKMPLKDINFPKLITLTKGFSGAEIKAVCTEAGYLAMRKNKDIISEQNFLNAIKKIKERETIENKNYKGMFG